IDDYSYYLNLISLGRLGHPYYPCGRQADQLASTLGALQLRHNWSFDTERMINFNPLGILKYGQLFHQYVIGKSDDLADPLIVLDPWKNEIFSAPATPGTTRYNGHDYLMPSP